MKLGEALTKRSQLAKQLVSLQSTIPSRLTYTVKADGTPASDEDELVPKFLTQYNETRDELRALITNINLTNAHEETDFKGQKYSITALIALREDYGAKASFFKELTRQLERTSSRSQKGSRSAFAGLSAYDLAKAESEGIAKAKIEEMQTLLLKEKEKEAAEADKVKLVISFTEAKTKTDSFSALTRQIDTLLQEVNWNTDLREYVTP